MKKDTMIFALLLAVSTFFSACEKENIDSPPFEALDPQVPSTPTNTVSDDRMLLVLKAPSLEEMQYEGLDAQTFTEILDFTINYANSVIGKDNVVVVCEPATKAYLSGRLPEDIILVGGINHIWMRDFTVVNPYAPVQFDYTDATMSRSESNLVQATWTNFANLHNLDFSATDYELDGGNIVDDYDGRVITTTRFLEDNNLSYAEGVQVLKELLGATEVGIIPPDEDALAHSDGMVMWAEKNVLLVNDFSFDPQLRQGVMTELNRAFPTATIVEVPVQYQGDGACGINVNATVTLNNIYVPTYNLPHETEFFQLLEANTNKQIVKVPAYEVCDYGGAVRCLTLQLAGDNAAKLIEAAAR